MRTSPPYGPVVVLLIEPDQQGFLIQPLSVQCWALFFTGVVGFDSFCTLKVS